MAKSQIDELTPEQVNDSIVIGSETVLPITNEQAFSIIEKADISKMEDLTSTYHKFDAKGRYVFKVTGFDVADINGNSIDVVRMEDKSGANLINGDKVFYNACKRLKQLPAYVIASYVADIKNPKGTYKDIRVHTFPVKG